MLSDLLSEFYRAFAQLQNLIPACSELRVQLSHSGKAHARLGFGAPCHIFWALRFFEGIHNAVVQGAGQRFGVVSGDGVTRRVMEVLAENVAPIRESLSSLAGEDWPVFLAERSTLLAELEREIYATAPAERHTEFFAAIESAFCAACKLMEEANASSALVGGKDHRAQQEAQDLEFQLPTRTIIIRAGDVLYRWSWCERMTLADQRAAMYVEMCEHLLRLRDGTWFFAWQLEGLVWLEAATWTKDQAKDWIQRRNFKLPDALDVVKSVGQQPIVSREASPTADNNRREPATLAAPTTRPARPKRKRNVAQGDARDKIIAGLSEHHKYSDGGALNTEPIGVRELRELLEDGVSSGSISRFFKKEFRSHSAYKAMCVRGEIAFKLKCLMGEVNPQEIQLLAKQQIEIYQE